MLCLTGIIRAQKESTLKSDKLKKVIALVMPDGSGRNGAGVAWNPVQKIYYAAFAGNEMFPLAVFDIKGERIRKKDLTTKFDVRGIWYNSRRQMIQMNGYGDAGWAEYSLDSKGLPDKLEIAFEGQLQPESNATGAFNNKLGLVYFLNEEGNIDIYDIKTSSLIGTRTLHLNCETRNDAKKTQNASNINWYNTTTVMYTGIKDAEFALLFTNPAGIIYYSNETGLMTKVSALPKDAPISDMLNLAYANGIFWLFDRDNRMWIGYR
jgi:hypothetical protein